MKTSLRTGAFSNTKLTVLVVYLLGVCFSSSEGFGTCIWLKRCSDIEKRMDNIKLSIP